MLNDDNGNNVRAGMGMGGCIGVCVDMRTDMCHGAGTKERGCIASNTSRRLPWLLKGPTCV